LHKQANESKKMAKKLYYEKEFQNCNGDSRKTWEILYSLLLNKNKKQPPKSIEIDGSITHDSKLIAQHSTIAEKTVEQNSSATDNTSFRRYLNKPVPDSMFLQPTDPVKCFQ